MLENSFSLYISDGLFNICIESATDSSGQFHPCYLEGLLRTLLRLTEEKQDLFLKRKTQYQYLSFDGVLKSLSMSDEEFNRCIEWATGDHKFDLGKLVSLTADERAVFFRRETPNKVLNSFRGCPR